MVFTYRSVVGSAYDTFAQVKRAQRAQRLLEGVEPMGRGRQKAKATKVARKLKYFSPETDYAALERELVSASSGAETDDDEIDYEELASKYNVDDDEDDWGTSSADAGK
ncbi:hypothetical protein HMPREF0058_1171 [Actinomyces urogenitalis DSM 15434]|uniref:DUF3073 domain-containing protein n=3 Tax=root TaxID=1 RepID=C0W5M7_9ACTO|nr:hypothetical protein HMPREF0058_1171 [Actinomyces urogenitalis DSM 15434]